MSSAFSIQIKSYKPFVTQVSTLLKYKISKIDYINIFKMSGCSKLQKMKLPEDQLNFILQPRVLKLASLFSKYDYELRIAGGAVRDLLMGLKPKDFDFATSATPDEMTKMFNAEQVRLINKNGEKHGTITARIDEENFECTTLRIDVTTDGRRAEVKFIRDWELDAGRRDLTINALYLGLDGTIYDYFNGATHLKEKKLVFVGDPAKRIKEDYLRILRFFRFYGCIAASDTDQFDENVLSIIKNNASGLNQISGERVWMELSKIASRRFGGEIIIKMVKIGLGPHLGIPADFDCEGVEDLLLRLKRNNIELSNLSAVTVFSSGFSMERDVDHFIQRIKCSNKDKDVMYCIVKHKENIKNLSVINIQHMMADFVYKEHKSRLHSIFIVQQLTLYSAQKDLIDFVMIENIPFFPIKGGMLTDRVTRKKHISKEMKMLYKIWKESDFTSTKDELLFNVPVLDNPSL